ncbi:hypothetical protein FA13DRAFT_1771004 [Coprinellus micaceus]|uniref:RING-type E3 ubiquitin transferase n=1 Tax=Coprinellus micaceus TaxID=71717 RepID=A0A4Y7TTN1_COPMI|nr:hypothetical protein FA13DRAFT_1771004 [Coprinellus micaceus]
MPPSNEVLRQRLQTLAQFANTHRFFIYTFVSLTALGAVITNALKNQSNFYSVAIYLSKSSRSVLALANFGVLVALLCGHVVQRIFFGTLRANEVERLYDRLWFFITESLLAFTIFRDEFDTSFAFMFGFLLFVKSFHWLASDRIEWMDQRPYPGPPLLFHFRMAVLFVILWWIDLGMFLFTVEHTLSVGVGGMVLFASEYGILIASVMNTIAKYALSAYELRRAGQRGGENAPPWENKSMWVFYIELATDFLKLTIYLLFFTIIITFYGLPLNIVRDVYITARSFISRLKALHRYQTATRNMDQRYPNATEEELTAMSDRTCIICREEMVYHAPQTADENRGDGPNMSPKKLPCGHIFHFYCLRSWLERQQSCPTCRRTVLDATIPPNPRVNNPPAPAPGAAPQPPNADVAAAPQQAGNDGFGNPLGFANRFFGPPAQDINNPPAVQNQAPNPAQGAGQNPPFMIHYDLQYQPLYGEGVTPFTPNYQAQQPLTPVPRFPGFDANARPPGPTEGQAGPTSQPRDATSSTQVQPPETPSPRSPSPAVSDSSSDSSSDDGETLSPREAARAAALRRFGSSNSILPPTKTTPAPLPLDNASTIPAASTGATTSTLATSTLAPEPYPRLIPLFDPDHIPQASANPLGTPGYFPQPTPTYPASPIPPGLQHPQISSSPFGSLNGGRNAQAPPQTSARLPSHLNDEQLATMDHLTREAIDERLRVLERVSNTLYGCVDDLLRMRSSLPEIAPAVSGVTTHTGGDSFQGTSTSSLSTRAAEKRPETARSNPEEVARNGSHDD